MQPAGLRSHPTGTCAQQFECCHTRAPDTTKNGLPDGHGSLPRNRSIAFACILLLLLSSAAVQPTTGYRVLVFSAAMSNSHLISNARIADTLARAGHSVTLLEVQYLVQPSAMNASKFAGTTVIKVDGDFVPKAGPDEPSLPKIIGRLAFTERSLWERCNTMRQFQQAMSMTCPRFIDANQPLLDQLKAQQFDVYMGEQLTLCGSALSHLLAIPVHVLISSTPVQEHVAWLFGLPFPFEFVPSLFDLDMSDRMSFTERLTNLANIVAGAWTYNHGTHLLNGILRQKFGAGFPDIFDIVKRSPLIVVNVDEFVDFPRPLFGNIVHIGGLGMDQNTTGLAPLKEPLRSLMDSGGQQGIVFFSMGTVVDTADLDERFIRNVFASFAALPDYQFIVRVGRRDNRSVEFAKQIQNIHLTTWAPQLEILGHPRTRLFIGHGGYNGMLESARAGVPILAMGFFADQYRNGRLAERNGWGLAFNKMQLLHGNAEFQAAIRRVLGEPSFREGAKRISKILRTKPFSAEQRLVGWMRFLEANGGRFPELVPEAVHLHWAVAYRLDLAGALVALFVSIALAGWLAFLLARVLFRHTAQFMLGGREPASKATILHQKKKSE